MVQGLTARQVRDDAAVGQAIRAAIAAYLGRPQAAVLIYAAASAGAVYNFSVDDDVNQSPTAGVRQARGRDERQAPLFEDDLPWEERSPAERLIELLKSCSPRNQEQGMKWLETKPTDADIIAKIKTVDAALDNAAAKGGAA